MPHSEGNDAGIPVIDISSPSPEVAQQVLHAASTFGFLFIKNDGITIPPTDIDDMFELSRKFFKLPSESKAEYSINSSKSGGKNRGWVSMWAESLDPENQKQGDPKEAFNIAEPTPTLQPFPPPLSASSELISRFQTACHTLCNRILTLLATALSIPESYGGSRWFAERHDQSKGPSGTIFRLLYYPSTTIPKGGDDVRAGAHSDYGSITLLFRLPGQAGLEILKDDGSWAPVPVNPSPTTLTHPPILVNIGDIFSFWTNGMLKSTVHRVTFGAGDGGMSEERYSIAYFCHPLDSAQLEPIPSKAIHEFKNEELERQTKKLGFESKDEGGEMLTAKQHLDRRLKVTYGLKD
ncbi:Clavaminate synthase-like protein [Zopfia rhizophila CBS 207.26]|uniref:Clavaminate synthase-like protein n=1 Tax=Zopfia rhizophila CBS 207.26 TaxID=1314779 RepID=A0A6A6ECX0_9PEZI|nr:Clavaminate synthase-like protein [Zopfia rhizophila CBS 207.26]